MEHNRSLYKSVLFDIVNWESRERRGYILRKVPRAVCKMDCICLVKSSLESSRSQRYLTVMDQGRVVLWICRGFGCNGRRLVNNMSWVRCSVRTSTTYAVLHFCCVERTWLTEAPVILVEMDSVSVQWVRLETVPGATLKRNRRRYFLTDLRIMNVSCLEHRIRNLGINYHDTSCMNQV